MSAGGPVSRREQNASPRGVPIRAGVASEPRGEAGGEALKLAEDYISLKRTLLSGEDFLKVCRALLAASATPANARAVAVALEIAERAPELNMSNYDHDQVGELNAAMIDLTLFLRAAALPEAPQSETPASGTAKVPEGWEWEERYREMREAYLMFKRDVGPTLASFASLGGPDDGAAAAYHDLPDDVVIYSNSGRSITAGDVRAARKLVSRYVQPVCTTKRGANGN